MDIQKTFGHFGEVHLCVQDGDESFAPVVILRKAPLKYYDPSRDKDDKNDKSKADVIFAFYNGDWHMVGWMDHDPEAVDLDEADQLVCDKLNDS